jgi:cell fate regulator YaaT (PSP1 superfamily)
MPGSITLPQVVLDLEEEDRKQYEGLQVPKALVCRYGSMRMVAELPYDGQEKPGCGSKLVIRTGRGIELAEMLTTTCGNGGCGKSITRKQMLEYIENSGGRNYPFSTEGRVLRLATGEDLQEQQRLDAHKAPIIKFSKALIQELDLAMKLVDVEMLLGGERVIFHYTAEQWVDFRELVRRLAAEYQTRIEMHQVNARDEARIVADYEKCGQHCCCRQFLKVLKPVSMRSAKTQKATLDPTKISGRCGRLMCCLRYEDETYESLRKKLPHRQSRWTTPDGNGTVIDTQILTQLALVRLDEGTQAAYPIENVQPLPRDQDPMLKPGAMGPNSPGFQKGGPGNGPGAGGQGGAKGPRGASGPGVSGSQSAPGQPGSKSQERGRERRRDDLPPRRPQPGAPLQEEEIEAAEDAPLKPSPPESILPESPTTEARTGSATGMAGAGDKPAVEADHPVESTNRIEALDTGLAGADPMTGGTGEDGADQENLDNGDAPEGTTEPGQNGDDRAPRGGTVAPGNMRTPGPGGLPRDGVPGMPEAGQGQGGGGGRRKRRRRRRRGGGGPGGPWGPGGRSDGGVGPGGGSGGGPRPGGNIPS